MELRLTALLGEDSGKANKAVMAAGLQNRMWDASMRFYDVQGQENSGYVTDRFLRGVLGGVRGLDLARAMKDRTSADVRDELGAVYSMQRRYGVNSTPTLMIGTDDTDLTLRRAGRRLGRGSRAGDQPAAAQDGLTGGLRRLRRVLPYVGMLKKTSIYLDEELDHGPRSPRRRGGDHQGGVHPSDPRPRSRKPKRPRPKAVGFPRIGPVDVSENVDKYLAETGFGET